jgi:hypothetical protein
VFESSVRDEAPGIRMVLDPDSGGGVAGEGAVIMPKFQPIDRRVRAAITHYDSKACGTLGDCTGGFSTAGCYEPIASTIVGHEAFSCRRPPFRL